MTSPLAPAGWLETASSVPLALELAEDHLVRPPDDVGEHVQPAAVGHADHDLVRSVLRGQLERLVEHRDHHVEPLDRELLLAEERPAQVALEAFHLGEPREQPALLVGVERLAVRPDSIAWRSQTRSWWSEMCSISYAIVPQ